MKRFPERAHERLPRGSGEAPGVLGIWIQEKRNEFPRSMTHRVCGDWKTWQKPKGVLCFPARLQVCACRCTETLSGNWLTCLLLSVLKRKVLKSDRKRQILYHLFVEPGQYMVSRDGRVEGCAFIFSCENSKIESCCWTIIHSRMLDWNKKHTPLPRAKEKPQQDCRRGKLVFKIKPLTVIQVYAPTSNAKEAEIEWF